MQYSPNRIDQLAKKIWEDKDVYRLENDISKPKHYVLEMFPYPSGAGLHVGHPLGYVAGDIYARFKRMKGFNVLHPMGFDSFGLPAEQYAIETGKDPRDTTRDNIETYKKQFNKIGLSFDWSREVVTSSPEYYKWTQWLFIEMFNSIYCYENQCAYSVNLLIKHFEEHGNHNNTAFANNTVNAFSAEEWKNYSEKEKSDILMNYRLIYTSMGEVNWCEALGTVLANDEVINGRSERGNHLVVKKKMRQWSLRMTAYADRLLQGLEEIGFSNSLKDQQRNWIGKSTGALVNFKIKDLKIDVYTTRPDTIFGVTFLVLSPEHMIVESIITAEYKEDIEKYKIYCKSKSDIDRQAEKEVSGQFTGAYAMHPFTGKQLPIYIAEYVLMGYGTGAIMAVPAEDERDRKFAEKFGIEIVELFDKSGLEKTEIGDKQGKLINSDFVNGMSWNQGFDMVLARLEDNEIGERKTQFRLRDANYSRQRYWGEPIPILWKDDIPYPLEVSQLPLLNPNVDSFLPSKDGLAPNARNQEWVHEVEGYTREVDTMPAFAGSSWYFLRYMDPQNDGEFVAKDLVNYWGQVDLYQGGSEHAVGHLLYARYFNHFLYDRGYISHKEPFKRLINQGMIQGRTQFVYRSNKNENLFLSKGLIKNESDVTPIRIDVNMVDNDILDVEAFKKWRQEFTNAEFDLEDGRYICGWEIDKMSKRYYNVVNPDDIIDKYGADCFRMYEMFLGPIEQSKPWNTAGIEGVSKFLRRFWNLYFDENGHSKLTKIDATADELKVLHRTIDKLTKDIENFSFNTSVSALMIALNEFNTLKTTSASLLIPLLKSICPFAPHTAETIWSSLGNLNSIIVQEYPSVDESYLVDDTIEYPISINGKMRAKISLAADANEAIARESSLSNETIQKWLEGKEVKKFIFVKSRMINIVI